jgi:hypothetical protein
VVGAEAALAAISERARLARDDAEERWVEATSGEVALEEVVRRFGEVGRLTLNFHPDRTSRSGRSVAAALLADAWYTSQWVSGISAGSRSAVEGGERQRFERDLFGPVYEAAEIASDSHPVYGSLDLLFDDHGGSPRFGSSFLVLRDHVRHRASLCLGDSHMAPRDVGTFAEPMGVLAGLAEQASRGQLLGRGLGLDVLWRVLDGSYRSGRASRDLDGYVEVQVHGGVSLVRDVEAVVLDPSFRSSSVERDLTAAAERFGFDLAWHCGSELEAERFPDDFRGPSVPRLAQEVARPDGVVDAHAIGVAAARGAFSEPTTGGDAPESPLQQIKYLWHTLLRHGRDAGARPRG